MGFFKKAFFTLIGIIGTIGLASGSYIGYIYFSYYRIGDKELKINLNAKLDSVPVNEKLSISTYNIGFGAYSQDYTFFLDTGYDINGNKTVGHYSKALSKSNVYFNTWGAIDTIKNLNPDFVLFQEVDTNSTRSYHVNQNEEIILSFQEYDNIHAVNFHTPYLPYPLYDMHGKVNAGLTSLSRYKINKAERKEYTVSTSMSKFFDLDRCFSYSLTKTSNGKNLYIINSHMSAYDKGGEIKKKQFEELNNFLKERKDNGDYVVVGGDFNQDLILNKKDENPDVEKEYLNKRKEFTNGLKDPEWVVNMFDEEGNSPLEEGYSIVSSANSPTCRNNDIEWIKGKTYTCVVDGFIISSNIELISVSNIETKNGNKHIDGFAYSDHEPVFMEFKLK